MEPHRAAVRIAAFINGYGPDDRIRASPPETTAQRTVATHELLLASNRAAHQPVGNYVDEQRLLREPSAVYCWSGTSYAHPSVVKGCRCADS